MRPSITTSMLTLASAFSLATAPAALAASSSGEPCYRRS